MKNINIIGCGLMGSQIASLFSIMGYEVNIWNRSEVDEKILNRQKRIILKLFKTEDQLGKIKFVKNIEDLKDNVTIESLAEDINIKKSFLLKLKKNINKEIFTNSSSIKTNKISDKLNLLHFFNPIYLRIVEYKKVNVFSKDAEEIFLDLKKMNFDLIEVENFTGFAFNKILFAEISNFFLLIEKENVKKEAILKIFKKINSNLDVLNTLDLIGLDVSLNILENLKKEYNFYIPEILYLCKSQKILGKKNRTTIKTIFNSSNYPNKKK